MKKINFFKRKNNILDVLDVSRYIIKYSDEKLNGISNLKLQKILYFVQAYYLITDNKLCFKEDIVATSYGPVVFKAYNELKGFGALPIPYFARYIEYDKNNLWTAEEKFFDDKVIPKKDKEKINFILETFKDYSSTELNELVFNQEPWQKANLRVDKIIKPIELKKYFSK